MQPFVRALANQPMADLSNALNPLTQLHNLRRPQPVDEGYAVVGGQCDLGAQAGGNRQRAPWVADQGLGANRDRAGLLSRRARQITGTDFFGFYGSPFLQALLGINQDTVVRPVPIRRPKSWRHDGPDERVCRDAGHRRIDEALTRAVLYVLAANRTLDQRCALALNVARQELMRLSLAEFKVMVGISSSYSNSSPSAR